MADVLGLLAQLQRGQAIAEINEEAAHLIDQLGKTGGKAELVIKLSFEEPTFDHRTGRMTEVKIKHSLSAKLPKLRTAGNTFFLTNEGELSRNDPAQMELEEMMRD